MNQTETKTNTSIKQTLTRHLVELDRKGQPTDKCLCGHLWDKVFIPHNGEICQECVDEMRRRSELPA